MTGPSYHGRTHAPGGTDPIPVAGGIGAYARARTDSFNGDTAITVNAGTQSYSSFAHVTTSDASVISWSTTTNTNDTVTCHADGTYLFFASTQWSVVGGGTLAGLIMVRGGTGADVPHMFASPLPSPAVFDSAGNPNSSDYAVMNGNGSARYLLENGSGANRDVTRSYFVVVYIPTGLI